MQAPTAIPQAPETPQGSMPSSAPASSAGYPQAQAAPPQPSYPTQPAPGAPAAYQAPQPQVPYQAPQAPAGNPWEQALQGLYGSSSGMPSSLLQGQPLPQTPSGMPGYPVAPQAFSPPSPAGVMAPPAQFQQPVYSPGAYQQPQPLVQQAPAPVQPVVDGFLGSLSNQSLEVLQHFGAEAPALLNHYSCVVEDALLRQAQQTLDLTVQAQQLQANLQNAHTLIAAAAEDNAAYHTILSDAQILDAYNQEFFGPGGPGAQPAVPAPEGPRDRLAAEVAYGEARGQMLPPRAGARFGDQFALPPAPQQPQAMQAPASQQQLQSAPQGQPQAAQAGYQRPQLDMVPPGNAATPSAQAFWEQYSQMMDHNPRGAVMFFDQNVTPEFLMARQFMGEG